MQMGEGERERGRERIPRRLCVVSAQPHMGLDHMNLGYSDLS